MQNGSNIHSGQFPARVYYVESPQDDTVTVAIDIILEKYTGKTMFIWFDTSHERRMIASEIHKNGDSFSFIRDNGYEYFFEPMNISIYNSKVRPTGMDGGDFDNDDELIAAFLKTIEDAD